MPTQDAPWTADRLANLARAAAEVDRTVSSDCADDLALVVSGAHAAVGDDFPEGLLTQLEGTLASGNGSDDGEAAAKVGATSLGSMEDVLKQRASLDLKLQSEIASRKELEKTLETERTDYKQAIESLNLQRAKIKELEEGRSKMLVEFRGMEDKFRMQISETEQAALKLRKLQESRQTLGDQATSQSEKLNALMAENEDLRQQVEASLRDRDSARDTADVEVSEAESQTEQAAFAALWKRMSEALPDIFIDTHVPTRKTFENISDGFVEMLRTMAVIEAHVHHMLKELRQVGTESDALSRFYTMFAKNPKLVVTMREYLSGRKRTSNVANLVRALQAWARAFGSGLHKAVLRSDAMLSEELNYRKWPVKSGFGKSEDQVVGKYFREVAQKAVPDKFGTDLRKQAADYAYQDFNSYMKKTK